MFEALKENLDRVEDRICESCARCARDRSEITLCAVSKTRSAEEIDFVAGCGVNMIAENYASEITRKIPPAHPYFLRMIGHLQTNKVKRLLPVVDSVDSVDSLHLFERMERAASAIGKRVEILLELNSSTDATKTGFRNIDDVRRVLDKVRLSVFLSFNGFMTMGPASGDETQIRKAFDRFNNDVDRLAGEYQDLPFHIRSFGMSDDFDIAVEMGSTMLRIGRAIFGERTACG